MLSQIQLQRMYCVVVYQKGSLLWCDLCVMWPHSGVDLGPIKMANIPDDRVVSRLLPD